MDFRRHALILEVIEQLKKNGSWTGKTHIQKSMFLVHEATSVDVPFDFVLYKHGPYSFDIESELEEMRSYSAIAVQPVAGYGVQIAPGDNVKTLNKLATLTLAEKAEIARIVEFVGDKDVSELERIATAVWIRQRKHITDSQGVAACLNELKPHVSIEDALEADGLVTEYLMPKSATLAA